MHNYGGFDMSKIYERIVLLCDKAGISGYKLCKDIGVQPSMMTDLKMGRQTGLSAKNAAKVATYFNVPMSYLLGDTDDPEDHSKTHWAEAVSDDVPEEVIKAAFFRGSKMSKEEIDRSWEDAKEFATFKAAQRKAKDGK